MLILSTLQKDFRQVHGRLNAQEMCLQRDGEGEKDVSEARSVARPAGTPVILLARDAGVEVLATARPARAAPDVSQRRKKRLRGRVTGASDMGFRGAFQRVLQNRHRFWDVV